MKIYEKKEQCCGCEACVNACPVQAIQMKMDSEGFYYPHIDTKKCIHCNICKKVCQINKDITASEPISFYGLQAKKNEYRFESSSGGLFPLVAEYILLNGGAVCAATQYEGGKVEHVVVEADASEAELFNAINKLQKTKYVQSRINNCYIDIKNLLKQGKKVLFTGTPCQCEGLRLYLIHGDEKNTALLKNLYLSAIICYGVPSPGIWSNYVKGLEQKHKGTLNHFSFRDKRARDNGHMISYTIDEKEYAKSLYHDFYSMLYFKNKIIRPSCHNCRFCTPDRSFDFTIGDFWGIDKVKPDFDDGMGNSLLIIHSEKASKLWELFKDKTRYFECKKEDIMQPRLCEPAKPEKYRTWKSRFWLKAIKWYIISH